MWKFVSLVDNVNVAAESFEEAFRAMYAHVRHLIAEGKLDYQILETSIWIECSGTGTGTVPIFFYDARDRAYDEGIMQKIQSEVCTIPT